MSAAVVSIERTRAPRGARVVRIEDLDLAAIVRPGDTVLSAQATAEPVPLTAALREQRHAIGRFNVFLGMSLLDTFAPAHTDVICFSAYCGTGGNAAFAKAGKLDILPCHYSQLPQLIRSGQLRVDVLMLHLAPLAGGGFSMGVAHEYLSAALDVARVVVAEVNARAPVTHGDLILAESDIDFMVHTSRPVPDLPARACSDVERAIARHVAGLIDDRSTLQLGIGAIPEAVVSELGGRRDLGVHSGTFGDGLAMLQEQGVITNAFKGRDAGRSIAGLVMGSQKAYRFVHDNPAFQLCGTEYVHNPDVLASLRQFVAINSAVQVDLTGQINSEVANGVYIGTVGGAVDFLRGAARSRGGLPIVALPSTAGKHGRIAATLGGPVSTARSDAGVIVTEYGVADLRGKRLAERVEMLIAIAHPDHRPRLRQQAESLHFRGAP